MAQTKLQTRMVNGIKFERTGEGYIYYLSKRHYIFLSKQPKRGWMAEEKRLIGKGKYMEGEKHWETVNTSEEETMEEALAVILDEL